MAESQGKPVTTFLSCSFMKTSIACSTPADYFDSYAVFEYLISRELRHCPAETRARVMYQHMSSGHNSKLDKDWRQAERLALGLPTIFDVLEHGKGLTDRVFKD